MLDATTTQWDAIDQWSPTLFLIGDILLAGHALVQAGTHTPEHSQSPADPAP